MNSSKSLLTACAFCLALGTSGLAIAKGHDQGIGNTADPDNMANPDPGENVGEQTVTNAQGVAVLISGGNGKGAQGDLGQSRSAATPD